MGLDIYDFSKPFTFKHKERTPRWLLLLDMLFLFSVLIMIIAFVVLLVLKSFEYVYTEEQVKFITLFTVTWICFALFVAVLNGCIERFNFYYTVTVFKNSFDIRVPTRGSINYYTFQRKITYKFNEKSKLVYMLDYKGERCCFRYDEPFRKFLEEIQIK